jgi:hypothetical protein
MQLMQQAQLQCCIARCRGDGPDAAAAHDISRCNTENTRCCSSACCDSGQEHRLHMHVRHDD